METSDRIIDGSRRPLVVAATIAVVLGAWGGAADGSPSAAARAPAAFRWLHPQRPPLGWKLARLPSRAATVGYPRSWKPIRTDPGTASVALVGRAGLIRGYLNITPRQGTETLADWPSFRIEHLGDEGSSHVHLIAAARGLEFRSGRGSCVIDTYLTSRARYREIACLVKGARTSSVIVAAALSKTWPQQASTLERAISSFRAR